MKISSQLKALAVGLLLIGLQGCGTEDSLSDVSVVGGSDATRGGIIESSTVAIADNYGNVFCTGTLISDTHVVSAAHCLHNKSSINVAFGTNSDNFQYIRAARFKANDIFDFNTSKSVVGDIGMIELSSAAPAGFNPVEIHTSGVRTGDRVYVAGFGRTENYSSGALKYKAVTVSGQDADEITVSSGSCNGDSGGPLYIYDGSRLTVVGATSRGSVADCSRATAYYTSIPYFLSWMESWAGTRF